MEAKRFKTFFGVTIPPWRVVKWNDTVTLTFVLTGRIPSKKNELIAVVERKDAIKSMENKQNFTRSEVFAILGKTYGKIVNSKSYKQWETDAIDIIKEQLAIQQPMAESKGIIFPVPRASIKLKFHWKDKHRRDNSNKSEGIMDVLVASNVIIDDSYTCTTPTTQDAREYSTEIITNIAQILVTIPIK